MTDVARMGRYDRAGVVSGVDMPLPADCQTATCIHREHQLSNVHTSAAFAVRCAAGTCREDDTHDVLCMGPRGGHILFPKDMVVPGGWCMPASPCAMRMCTRYDEHEESCATQGWDLDPVPWDGTVAGLPPEVTEGTMVGDPFGDFLDLPEISVRRGGIRHTREFWPKVYDVERSGLFWYVYETTRATSHRIGHGKWTKRAAISLRDSLRAREKERAEAWYWESE